MRNCPEGFETEMRDIIDEFEIRVNSAKALLDAIKGTEQLDNVQYCKEELNTLSRELY